MNTTNGTYECGIQFYTAVVSPQLERAAAGLDFLELSLSTGSGPISHMLAELSWVLASTTCPLPTIPYTSPPLVLPSLLSLKVRLDNATFSVLSTWAMPALPFSAWIPRTPAKGSLHSPRYREISFNNSSWAFDGGD